MKKRIDFSFRRCFLLMWADLVTFRNEILVCTFALILFLSAGFWLNVTEFENEAVPGGMYFIFLIAGGTVLTSIIFRDLHKQKNGLVFLSLPASHAEKYFCRFFLSTFGYVFVLTLVFLLLQWVARQYSDINATSLLKFLPSKYLYLYFILHALFFYGSVRFKSMALMKTLLSSAIIYIVSYAIIRFVITLIFYNVAYIDDFEIMVRSFLTNPWDGGWYFFSMVFYPRPFLILPIMCLPLPLILWPAAYFRLRESEI